VSQNLEGILTSFEFLTVALSFVLGLATTVLLTSALAVFRARKSTRISWVPLAWAGYVLLIQFIIWWELYGLVELEQWTIGSFAFLLLITLLLFAAGGLVLPSCGEDYPADLHEYFQEDGRWAVALIAALFVVGSVANVVLFEMSTFSAINLFNALGILLLGASAAVGDRRIQGATTLLFGLWLAAYFWVFVPKAY
jgi:hypothetical protein